MKTKINKKVTPKETVSKKKIDNDFEKEYLNSIKKLEILFEESFENFKRKIEGEISQLNEVIEEKLKNQQKTNIKTINKIDSLKVKPKKGRAKDLLRIEKLLKELLSDLTEKEQ